MKSQASSIRILLALTAFAVAMGFLEAIVVVYLRKLYFPQGFTFPLNPDSIEMVGVEWVREIVTIVMLAAVGYAAFRDGLRRLLGFLFCFGVWDIFYYIALKLLVNWPPSVFTWDVLFLIPITWLGPVLAPSLCALVMICMAVSMISMLDRGYPVALGIPDWSLLGGGSILVLATFLRDYVQLIVRGGFFTHLQTLSSNPRFLAVVGSHVPQEFMWGPFFLGLFAILAGILLPIYRALRNRPKSPA